ncbi:hypothetical protein L2E82_19508 [Cichorium intybus]|uniref:Uncharacterized protein n=1 Tax=Cichorium intybus TaxID=13427 RepID=A0ACB9FD11_CICIN|nr:hypothetical protein L2E82_19508 [Cichorium intybus]
MDRRAALVEELAVLRQVDEFASKGVSPPRRKNSFSRACSLPPNARISRISSLENMFSISSNSLVSMTSQLSEAEERECGFANRGRCKHLRSMGNVPKDLPAGTIGGTTQLIVVHPFDTIKVKLQSQSAE